MLEISNITKEYDLKDQSVHALKGVSMCFRKSEFVSILGPSGCGKTTLLNIIGGLDRYTSGDLIIDGKSTKEFKDKDWDTYRNHRVGFVFQTYNLIPHQTVLENVELALTLSGISKKERKHLAEKALKDVGLGDKIKSKPNQLSGGQMQRVAIARALVNNPDIILADEPTGALDSKTSVQIMELLKKVSKRKLVIMVTHNPELAENYSNRIIRLLDGELIEDTNPYLKEELLKDVEKHKKKIEKLDQKELKKKNKKKSMSFFTALSLSFKNLLTKKARTILVAFAGSIGIIGIALILAISSGFSTYINRMQEDTLTSYPITVEAKSVKLDSIISSMLTIKLNEEKVAHKKDAVYPKDEISNIIDTFGNSLRTNNLKNFKSYLEENKKDIEKDVTAIKYDYNLNLSYFTGDNQVVYPSFYSLEKMIVKYSLFYFQEKTHVDFTENDNTYTISVTPEIDYTFMENYLGTDLETKVEQPLKENGFAVLTSEEIEDLAYLLIGTNRVAMAYLSSVFGTSSVFYEMLDNEDLIKEQYQLLGENSRFPQNKNEVLLVLDKNTEVDEYLLYNLHILSDAQLDGLMQAKAKGEEFNIKINYDEIIGKEYKVFDDSDYYVTYNDEIVKLDDLPADQVGNYTLQQLNNANKLKIVGVVRVKDNVTNGSLSTGIAYTKAFSDSMIEHYNSSLAVTSEKLPSIDVSTPSKIKIYVNSFSSKDNIKSFISKYNKTAQEGDEISYTDEVGIIMSTVSTIINSITYVLIAFVSVSLIVSSIMIGIITYISVIERTKEIGVLRSIGASKRDVKRVFTAESFIVGFMAGLMGILITLLLMIPINIILKNLTGIAGLASLPVLSAFLLILISVVLTFIAGLFPSHAASKKDPVIALRTE